MPYTRPQSTAVYHLLFISYTVVPIGTSAAAPRHPDLEPNNLGPSQRRHRTRVSPQRKTRLCNYECRSAGRLINNSVVVCRAYACTASMKGVCRGRSLSNVDGGSTEAWCVGLSVAGERESVWGYVDAGAV